MEAPVPIVDPRRSVTRSNLRRLAGLASLLLVLHGAACNTLLGNEERALDDVVLRVDEGGRASLDSAVDSGALNRVDNSLDASVTDAATSQPDAADAGLRMPDPTCVKASGAVSPNAVRKVEVDTSPAPVKTATTVTASFTISGDNALSNVHLDFCTPDGPRADIGGGTNFLGGGGAVTRRWQTKSVTAVPVGRVQAQVYSEDPPVLRYLTNIDLY